MILKSEISEFNPASALSAPAGARGRHRRPTLPIHT